MTIEDDFPNWAYAIDDEAAPIAYWFDDYKPRLPAPPPPRELQEEEEGEGEVYGFAHIAAEMEAEEILKEAMLGLVRVGGGITLARMMTAQRLLGLLPPTNEEWAVVRCAFGTNVGERPRTDGGRTVDERENVRREQERVPRGTNGANPHLADGTDGTDGESGGHSGSDEEP